MGARGPIPLRERAEGYGHKAGEWARRAREQMERGQELAAAAQQFWREIQKPQGRQRHLRALLALAAGAGLLVGFLTGRRRRGRPIS